ncbi:MAG: glycosyltransferase family 2 protein [Bacteroidales bacterium]|nr:glycosyltransferase family 2 protein [Bacteroidales bacterium]
MSNFKVSIIIPVYNSEKYISEAVLSCINQRQTGEVILIDDGSKDNSLSVIDSLSKKYEKVKVLQHSDKKNHGRSASRNLGIMNAKCDFVAFLDSDDFFADNRFDYEEKIFESNPEIGGVYGITSAIFENENARTEFLKRFDSEITKVNDDVKPEELYKTFILGGFGRFTTDSVVFKKSVFEKSGLFFTEQKIKEDTSLWCRIAATSILVPNNNPKTVGIRRVHNFNSITNSDDINAEQERIMYFGLLRWALKQKSFSYDKKNDFYIAASRYFLGENEKSKFKYFLKQDFGTLFSRFGIRKFIQVMKN